ncbi:MAG TPA: hypothetical protein VKU00_15925 [Chthonomonadaceae bacterium]|nr:hypothetical protein [Chthonomonadaceae bacterium]
MPRKGCSYVLLPWLPILLVCMGLFLTRLWTQHVDQMANLGPYGRYSAQQVVERSRTMCRDLVPETATLHFTSAPLATHDNAGKELRKWQVEYRDAAGSLSGILQWNADTGLLEKVSQHLPEDPRFAGRLSSSQAADMSLYWMEKLQMVREKRWRMASAPRYEQGIWRCQLLSGNAGAIVIVRANDGLLTYAHIIGI